MSDSTLIISVVVVIGTVLFVVWIGQLNHRLVKTILDWFPAILFAYVLPAGFTHLFNLDLSQVALHHFSRNWIIPFAILSVMSALPFRQLRTVGFKPIIVFGIGSLVISILPVLLVMVFSFADAKNYDLFVVDQYWKGLVPIVGGWIGGSTSQLVLKELAETPESLFLSILVLDNILVNLWTILMFQFIKQSEVINERWNLETDIPILDDSKKKKVRPNTFLTLTVIVLVMIAGHLLGLSFLVSVVVLSCIGLLLGNVVSSWNHAVVLRAAGFAIIAIMSILGLKLSFANLILPAALVFLVILWLLLHFACMLIAAKLLKVNVAWVAIGSMANLGGISTAPAVTSAYKKELMPHAIVLAILSMVTGTSWGMLTIYLFGLV